MSRNISKVYLLSTPLENDYKNTLYFASREAQQSYFSGLKKTEWTFEDFTYQRKDNIIRIPAVYDDVVGANYVMYQNPNHSNKWYYAFITDMKYINEERTDVTIETDVIQTWLFDYTVKPSFVEREHVSDDTIGKHTIDEGLETGDYIINAHEEMGSDTLNDLCYILGTTANPATGADIVGGDVYNGIYSGVSYYRYDTPDAINEALKKLSEGKADSITGLFIAPKFLAYGVGEDHKVPTTKVPSKTTYPMNKNYSLNGYTPRNNKLKCFPYNYFAISNNAGSNAIYQYEYFSTETCVLELYGALCPSCSFKLVPCHYKGSELNHDEGLSGGKYPVCNYGVDMYTNWITQNSVNVAVDSAGALASLAIGAASLALAPATAGLSLAGLAAVGSGFGKVMNVVGKLHQASFMPVQASGNLNCGDVVTSMGDNCFQIYKMSIKKEFAQIIDGFFDMYGYKVNLVKTPNKAHRQNYWFTKTINVNITGDIHMKDMEIIKKCYDNGITFWRNAANIKNYSVDNSIV